MLKQSCACGKYGTVASGNAVLYLRLPSPKYPGYREKIWDHAAGVLVIEEAGDNSKHERDKNDNNNYLNQGHSTIVGQNRTFAHFYLILVSQ